MSDEESLDTKALIDISDDVASGIQVQGATPSLRSEIDQAFLTKLCDAKDKDTASILGATLTLADASMQPAATPECPFSLSLAADILVFFTYSSGDNYENFDAGSRRLEMTLFFHDVLLRLLRLLNMHPAVDYTTIENLPSTWKKELKLWVPQTNVHQTLHIIYPACCILLLAIHKMYLDENLKPNLAYSPYVEFFCRLWNTATGILILGLEIDRRLETEENELSPDIVIETLRGASSIRFVLAYILNSNPCSEDRQYYHHDLFELSIADFMSVARRKSLNGGSLRQELDCFAFSSSLALVTAPEPLPMLEDDRTKEDGVLGLPAVDVEDRYDEDLDYIFGSDEESLDLEQLNDAENQEEWADTEFDDANDDNETELTNEELHKDGNKALDWKDIPRGSNGDITEAFREELEANGSELFFNAFEELYDYVSLEKYTDTGAAGRQKFLRTIAAAIYQPGFMDINMGDFIDFLFAYNASSEELLLVRSMVPVNGRSHFEMIMRSEAGFAGCLFDELLMTPNRRRNAIWLLCEKVSLSHNLINYVFELLTRRRGTPEINEYPFSRRGPLVLSEVEEAMLIHEFLSGASQFVAQIPDNSVGLGVELVVSETVANKYVTMLCLMINRLIDQGVITIKSYDDENDIRDYTTSIKNFAIDWIAKNKDARELFFRVEQSRGTVDWKNNEYLNHFSQKQKESMRRIARILAEEGYFGSAGCADPTDYENMDLMEISRYIDEFRDRIITVFNVYYKRRQLDSKTDAPAELRPSNWQMVGSCLRAYYRVFNELRTLDYFHDDIFHDQNCKVMLDASLASIENTQLAPPAPDQTDTSTKPHKKKATKKTKHKKK